MTFLRMSACVFKKKRPLNIFHGILSMDVVVVRLSSVVRADFVDKKIATAKEDSVIVSIDSDGLKKVE